MNTMFEQFANEAFREVATRRGTTIEAKDGGLVITVLKSPEEIIIEYTPKPELSYKDSWVIKAMQAYADQQTKSLRDLLSKEQFELKSAKAVIQRRDIQIQQEREMRKELVKELEGLERLFYAGYTIRPSDTQRIIKKASELDKNLKT